MFKDYK